MSSLNYNFFITCRSIRIKNFLQNRLLSYRDIIANMTCCSALLGGGASSSVWCRH